MDLWVVKYASRRSRVGDFSGDSSVRGARIRGVLAYWDGVRADKPRWVRMLAITGGCSMAVM